MTVDIGNFAIAIVALAISTVSFFQSRRVDRENLELQRRVTQIEEARREEEIAHSTQAVIRAELRRPAQRSGYFLVVTNTGGATAENVNVDIAAFPRSRTRPAFGTSPFPVAALHPGDQITGDMYFPSGSGRMFEAIITWTDPRGPQSKSQTVTFSPD